MSSQRPEPWQQPQHPSHPHHRPQQPQAGPAPAPPPQPQLPPHRPSSGLVDPNDVRATLAARRELGPDMEQALVDSFVARVELAIREQGAAGVDERHLRAEAAKMDSRNQMVLGIVSLIFAIPLTAIAAGTAGITGMLIAWVAIVLVNMAYALRKGRRD